MTGPSLPYLPPLSELGKSLLSSFASPFTQTARLFTLRFAEDSGIGADLLLPHHLRGVETLSDTYLYQVEALSPSAYLRPDQFNGQPVEIGVLLEDGGERLICGLVTAFGQLGSDGGCARYVLHIEPFLALLTHARNAKVRQDMTVDAVIADVLAYHRQHNPIVQRAFEVQFRLSAALPTLSYSVQHESDLAYIERLMAQYGLYYVFEFKHDQGHPVHVMVISDGSHAVPEGKSSIVRFAGANASEDTITQWSGLHQVQPGMVSLTSYNYKTVTTDVASARTASQGDVANQLASTLHDYSPQPHYAARGDSDLQQHAQWHQEAYDFQAQRYTGLSSVRSASPATTFELRGHPVHDQQDAAQRRFTIVTLVTEAHNNLPQDTQTALGKLSVLPAPIPTKLSAWFRKGQSLLDGQSQQRPYANVLECVPSQLPIRMPYVRTDYALPPAPACLTATVIGPEGEEVYTDDQGRVQIQYDFESHTENLAPGSTNKTTLRCWVRVMNMASGQQWGSQIIPRIGMEVVVLFLHGSWERMVCIGTVPNGTHDTPHFSNAGTLPANRTQTGLKTKEHHGTGYNQWLLDDTPGQLHLQLASTHANSKLAMGWLGTDRRDGQSTPRGEGIELVTQAAAALRSVGPLLLSTEPASANDTQLMRRALTQILGAALSLTEEHGKVAAAQGANLPETGQGNRLVEADQQPGDSKASGHQTQLKEAIDNAERGYNHDPEKQSGQGAQAGQQGVIALSAREGAAIASQQSITVAAGTNLDQTALRDTTQTSGRRWIHNAKESISLFVQGTKAKLQDTFKLIAATGNMSLQAQDGKLAATAKQDLTITSVNGKVIIQAPDEILLTAGGGYLRIGASTELGNPANLSMKAADFKLAGPANMPPELPGLPKLPVEVDPTKPLYSQQFDFSQFTHHEEDLGPTSQNKPYAAYDKQGNLLATGVTDAHGITDRIFTNEPKDIVLFLDEGEWNVEEYVELHEDLFDDEEENEDAGKTA